MGEVAEERESGNEFHDTVVEGNSGYLRTYTKNSSVVYWDGMRKRI